LRRWIHKAWSLVSLKEFESDSAEGRSNERYRRAALTAISLFGARGIQVLSSLITVPLTLHYLGLERYGMWMTISLTIAMFSFADFGVGNGLLNAISEAHGRGDRDAAARYVSSAFFSLVVLSAAIGLAFFAVYPLIDWSRVFNVHSALATAEAGPTMAVLVVCFLASLSLGVVQRVRMGYQEGFIDGLWSAAGSVGALVSVIAAVLLKASLPWLVLSMAAVPVVVQSANAITLFRFQRPWLRPRLSLFSRQSAAHIMRTGGFFFVLQVAGAIAYQSDSLILAHILGPESVTRYAVPMRLFMLTPIILGFCFIALWPAYGESLSRGETQWAKTTLFRSIKLGLAVAVPVSILLILFGKSIIRLWVGSEVVPSHLLLLSMGIWAILTAPGGSISSFLNGAGILRFQAVAAMLMMVANIICSIYLTKTVGISGVVWGSIISQTIFILLPTGWYISRLFTNEAPVNGAR